METWLEDLLDRFPEDGNWERRRRLVILARWPQTAQQEAMMDHALGRTEADGGKWERFQREVEAIKEAIPKPE